ncbi:HAD hydrolase-like protein [Parafrigoribacterium mesophilum]|uniref:HAD hydrolase-like protein n=1 Tax=Parafrigoribacterium mesophilum TaxID=433646 RepID=UPI0031FCE96B
MKPDWSCILFDLDGTIADSAPGITATLAHMFEALELPVPAPAELLRYVGPPILDAFRDFAGFSPEKSAHALAIYRKEYALNGVTGTSAYPGIAEVLEAIHDSGIPTSLATSKPELPATNMLSAYGLRQYFDVITGATEDETRSAKADVVAEALRRLAAIGADVSRPVMVGDRIHDVEGAAAHGVPTIYVEWGYGSPAEQAGAIAVAGTPEALRTLLLGDPARSTTVPRTTER